MVPCILTRDIGMLHVLSLVGLWGYRQTSQASWVPFQTGNKAKIPYKVGHSLSADGGSEEAGTGGWFVLSWKKAFGAALGGGRRGRE